MSDPGEDEQPEPVEVAGLDAPRYELVARAYHLHCVQHQTITYTAEALQVSRATAWRMAQEGKAQAKFLQSAPDEVVVALAEGAGWLVGGLAAEREAIGGRLLDYAPVILKALEFEAKIRGALAAQKVTVQGQGGGPVPDPDTVAALQALLEQNGTSP